jgi:hypothetical protein
LKSEISKHVPIKDLSEVSQLLGIEIIRDRIARTISFSHRRYIDEKIHKFRLEGSKPVYTPMLDTARLSKLDSPVNDAQREQMTDRPFGSLVGSLLHPAIMTRPDIRLAVQRVSQFLSNPGRAHWNAAIRILQYLSTTRDLILTVGGIGSKQLIAYCDADWGNSADHARSTSGHALFIGSGCFAWASKKQTAVALSSAESEYYSASYIGRQIVWLRQLIVEIGFTQPFPTPLFIDSNSAISMIGNTNQVSNRTKHINIQYHWIREAIQNGLIETERVDTKENVSDIFTKPLPRPRHEKLLTMLGMEYRLREDSRRGGVLKS